MTEPEELVVRSADGVFVIARLVVVAAPPVSVVYVARPAFEIEKSVVVAAAVDEPTAKRVEVVSPLLVWMENFAKGEEVPMPIVPEVGRAKAVVVAGRLP